MSYPQYSTGQSGVPQQPASYDSDVQEFVPDYTPRQHRQEKGFWASARKSFFIILPILLVLGVGGYFGWKKFGPDSGVEMCKAIAEQKNDTFKKDGGDKVFSEADYKKLREAFAGSRDPELRQYGVQFTDGIWQVSNMKPGEEMGALAFIGTLTSSYAGLTGACSKHGYTLPKMGTSK